MYYGEKSILRGLELDDIDPIMENFNDLEMRKYLLSPVPYSRDDEIDWIRSTWQSRKSGRSYTFAITDMDRNFLGTCSLESIHPIHRSATLGIAIYPKENWGKGYGLDALISLCWVGYNIINLNRIELEYLDFNIRGEKLYLKLGFKKSGVRREAYFVNGKYHDSIVMDLLHDEFNAKYPNLNLERK